MDELEQKLGELRNAHLDLAGRIKCLQELSSLYYDIRYWLGDKIMSLEEIAKIRETCVSPNTEKLNAPVSHQEAAAIFSEIFHEHGRLRDIARERKYK